MGLQAFEQYGHSGLESSAMAKRNYLLANPIELAVAIAGSPQKLAAKMSDKLGHSVTDQAIRKWMRNEEACPGSFANVQHKYVVAMSEATGLSMEKLTRRDRSGGRRSKRPENN